jgi:hypothetical protein
MRKTHMSGRSGILQQSAYLKTTGFPSIICLHVAEPYALGGERSQVARSVPAVRGSEAQGTAIGKAPPLRQVPCIAQGRPLPHHGRAYSTRETCSAPAADRHAQPAPSLSSYYRFRDYSQGGEGHGLLDWTCSSRTWLQHVGRRNLGSGLGSGSTLRGARRAAPDAEAGACASIHMSQRRRPLPQSRTTRSSWPDVCEALRTIARPAPCPCTSIEASVGILTEK